MKPRALDLFCGAGGATRGLQLAGFHVTGVDIKIMGIDWMLARELVEAIPPAYSEFIGKAALSYIRQEAAA